MTAISTKSKRRKNDFYATPRGATERLLESYPAIKGVVLECCSGASDIANVLLRKRFDLVVTNDIDPNCDADYHLDLSTQLGWLKIAEKPDWIVTNPPFCHAPEMVPIAYRFATKGIAMLLRLSFLEPCLNRVDFLESFPPTQLIVLPRISFTGDGKTDSMTCAWMIWDKQVKETSINIIGSFPTQTTPCTS